MKLTREGKKGEENRRRQQEGAENLARSELQVVDDDVCLLRRAAVAKHVQLVIERLFGALSLINEGKTNIHYKMFYTFIMVKAFCINGLHDL